MTGYTLHPRRAGNWQRHKDAIIAISVGAPYHEGERLAAIVGWAAQRFDRLHLQIGDTLQRHNSNAPDAYEQSKAAGDAWLKRNLPILQATGKLTTVTRWHELTERPEYPAVLGAFRAAARENTELGNALETDVQRFLTRQKPGTALPDAADRSREYVLEELAAITLHSRAIHGARLYPGPNLESLAMVEAGAVPQAPKGLEQQQRIHLAMRSKKLSAG